jgi:hypothetical protein
MSARDALETEKLKGYVPLGEYRKRREELQQDAALKSLTASVACAVGLDTAPQAAAPVGADGDRPHDPAKKKRKKAKGGASVGLSFGDEEGNDEDGGSAQHQPAAKRVFKAPGVDTSFLAKNATEKETEAKKQHSLLKGVLEQQERTKKEEVDMHYIFRNEQAKKLLGSQFYRGHVRVRRGETVAAILEAVHRKLSAELTEKVSSQLLLAVCSEYHQLIMQNHMSLFDIFALEWKEGGPMFTFGKSQIAIAERAFVDSNKHLFPINGWTLYDSFKTYSYDEAVRNRDKAQVGVEVGRGGKGGPPGQGGPQGKGAYSK